MALIRPSAYWRHVNPRGMVADFREVVNQAGPNKWRIGVLSALCTIGIFSVMWQEGGRGKPRPPEVTYIRVWDPHRTQAQIIASNIANQKRKEALAAEQAKREEDVRQVYKKIGRLSGIDVEAAEARANAERMRAGLPPLPAASPAPRP
jgi:hypothetical protein